jgi:endoribonuclease Dicer
MLLRHVIEQQLGDKTIPKRVAFFIVDKVALCLQQYDVIRCNLEWPVAKYFGDMQPHMQDEAFWDNQFDAHSVVVCTAQILLDCLDNGFISMSQISLLVFDEAHHAKKNHPYARIMKFHYPRGRSGHRPRILGLTASPIDTQDNDYRAAAEDLEALLCSEIATISDEVIEAGWQQQQVTENIHYYAPLIDPTESSTKLLSEIHAFASTVPLLRRYITQTQDLSFSLGPWCADRFWQLLFSDGAVDTVSAKAGLNDGLSYDYTEAVKASQSVDSVRQVVSVHHFRRPTERRELLSSKVHALRDILARAFENSRDKRCIVFVDQRYTARLLADLFSQPEVKPCGLTAGYLVR